MLLLVSDENFHDISISRKLHNGKLAQQKLSNALPHFHFLEQAFLIMQKEATFKILLDCRHLN